MDTYYQNFEISYSTENQVVTLPIRKSFLIKKFIFAFFSLFVLYICIGHNKQINVLINN